VVDAVELWFIAVRCCCRPTTAVTARPPRNSDAKTHVIGRSGSRPGYPADWRAAQIGWFNSSSDFSKPCRTTR